FFFQAEDGIRDRNVTGVQTCALPILMLTNNLRDIPTDALAGKRTLAVRLGERGTRTLYSATVLAPFALMLPVMVVQWPVALVLGSEERRVGGAYFFWCSGYIDLY